MGAQDASSSSIVQAQKRIAWLNKTLEHHNELYYQQHRSEISDYEYDQLMHELIALEVRFPSLRTPTSASLRVGGSVHKEFPSATHKARMLSLDNTYEIEEIRLFLGRVDKNIGAEAAISYVCEPKLDGVAISLHYKRGVLSEAVTRGDGEVGEVVTDNIRTIRSLPLQVVGDSLPVHFEVRGEVIMSGTAFEELNAERNVKARSMSDALLQVKHKLDKALLEVQNSPTGTHNVEIVKNATEEAKQAIRTAEKTRQEASETLDKEFKGTQKTLKRIEEYLERIEEVFHSPKQLKGFQKLLEQIDAASARARKESSYANPRNTVAGSIKLQKSAQVAKRQLDIYLYGLLIHETGDFDADRIRTHMGQLEWLMAHRFKTTEMHRGCRNLEDIAAYISDWDKKRASFPVETDGVVIKVNDIAHRLTLGETSKSPSWAIAYKYAPAQVFTQLRQVVYQVGRTGIITPVAEVEPVLVEGTTVCRASLHNQDEIERLGLHYNDYVAIEKSGHIIPKVMQIDTTRRQERALRVTAPIYCPSCQTLLVRTEDKVALLCPNTNQCPDQQLGRLEHFVSRAALAIEALGKETLKAFLKKQLIQDPGDLYALNQDVLLDLEIEIEAPNNSKDRVRKLGEKSAYNILTGIEQSKQKGFSSVLYGLGIPHVGRATADTLVQHLGTMEAIRRATVEELCEIPDIGPTTAKQIHDFLRQDEQKKLIAKLYAAGVRLAEDLTTHKEQKETLKGKKVVVSGRFRHQSRDELKALIGQHGGRCVSSLSAKVDYLVVGEEAGERKLKQASAYGTTLFTEDEFLKMLNSS